jgi:hypothetical protein
MNQVHDLAWHTAVFRTLNEARRLEPNRTVNGALWELTTAGYASLMTLGIRKLVDKDPRTNSVWNLIVQVEKRPELLTREKFVCYDGLPYNYVDAQRKYYESVLAGGGSGVRWLPTKGPDAWTTSELLHQAVDRLAGNPQKRKRTDSIDISILAALRERLSHSTIEKVCTMADRRVAHAERLSEGADAIPIATYNNIDEALKHIIQVANFLSTSFFYDAAFGSVVPTPQFDVLEGLDQPWILKENLSQLHKHWHDVSNAMNNWINYTEDAFLRNSKSSSTSG